MKTLKTHPVALIKIHKVRAQPLSALLARPVDSKLPRPQRDAEQRFVGGARRLRRPVDGRRPGLRLLPRLLLRARTRHSLQLDELFCTAEKSIGAVG